jgi:hypothetical protein
MKKDVFRIIRGYRKSFAFLASHNPNQAIDFWLSYYNKTEGVMSLFAIDNSVSIKEYMLINRYLGTQWQRLYIIYCK